MPPLAVRKTSRGGTDFTSATGGSDDDPKKPGTGVNRIKKTSIKRKVPNFSHDSDDAIVEPLLQTEKEHSVDVNKSAKYLLNKSKTDCLYENDTKPLETSKVSTPVSVADNVTDNIISEDRPSPSIISEEAPIYHHMNVNVLSGLDLEKFNIPTGNSILIEIDACGAVCHGPSPFIFTTAKIHADTKKKVMELFQGNPMPILSTIESDVRKTGTIHEDDKRKSNLLTNKYDISKNGGTKSDFQLEPKNFNEVLTNETLSNSIQIKNQQNTKTEKDGQDPFEKSAKIFSKDQKVSLKTSNANNVDLKSPISKVTSDDAVTTKTKPTIATTTCKANGSFISETSKRLIGTDSKSITSDKNNITDKSKGLSDNETMNLNRISHTGASSAKQNNKSDINMTHNDKMDSTKSFSTSSKKLQRQKNASIEEIKDINYKESNNTTTVKNTVILDKPVSTPLNIKSDGSTLYKTSTTVTIVTTKNSTPIVASGITSNPLNSSAINPSVCKSTVTTGSSAPINVKPITETVKTTPAPTRIPEPFTKSASKISANVTPIVTTAASSKSPSTSIAKSAKVTDDRSFAKQDFTSVSVLPSKITKTDVTTTSSSALPLYIVSTSKTKIGSSSTPSISTVTKKTLDQKPITEVTKTDGKSEKTLIPTTSSQSNQSSSKPKITNIDIIKKDNRA